MIQPKSFFVKVVPSWIIKFIKDYQNEFYVVKVMSVRKVELIGGFNFHLRTISYLTKFYLTIKLFIRDLVH